MIYLSSPFSHPDPTVRARRHEAACRYTANCLARGFDVISPIAHGFALPAATLLPISEDRWMEFSFALMARCDLVRVLKIDGWKESRGVRNEIAYAREHRILVEFVDVDDG